jgi:prepilin-type N-terminal cleavage/methylation domain-containing protein
MKRYKNSQAFSLLELLVVVGIISVLLAIIASSYSTAQKKTRDAKRASDLKTIQQAAEQYYSVCGYQYPDFSTVISPIICQNNPTIVILPTDKLPHDPRGTPYSYGCLGACDTSSFTICATPELESSICVSSQQ